MGTLPYRWLYLILYLMFKEPENLKEEFMVFANFYHIEVSQKFNSAASELDFW